ncbi:MAG TPA: MarR family transcriptional regulator [Thermoanaerobaculia bacterium]
MANTHGTARLAQLVLRLMSEMHRFDDGRTLPILHASKLTTPQLAVLELTRTPCTVSAVADHLRLSRPATSQLVDKLVRLGLVRRDLGAEDRRERRVSLTRKGEGLLRKVAAARAARFETSLATLPPPVAARLAKVLAEVVETLAQRGASTP